MDGGSEACPEVGGFLGGGIRERRGRGRREDGNEVGFGVGREVKVWDGRGEKEVGWRGGDDEDCR